MAIDINEVRRREEVGRELGLLINDVMVAIPHQRAVVRVEELLCRVLQREVGIKEVL